MPTIPPLPDLLLRPIVEAALHEDIRSGDVTTGALVDRGLSATAKMVFRGAGTVCGLHIATLVFQVLQADAAIETLVQDGAAASTGQAVLKVSALASTILTAERVALNFMQRMSGIATLTQALVQAAKGTRAAIIDTRKTTPGLRLLEKYAVRCGGGHNHRFALDDLILIKDNHIALCGGIRPAVERAKSHAGHSLKIEVECDTLQQVEEAAACGCDIILLDNMTPEQMAEAIQLIHQHGRGRQILTEASGNIKVSTVRAVAESGVDLISVGAITHSAGALDIGLDIQL